MDFEALVRHKLFWPGVIVVLVLLILFVGRTDEARDSWREQLGPVKEQAQEDSVSAAEKSRTDGAPKP